MDMFYAEKLWQKAKEQWGVEDTHPSYNKILQAFVWGVKHVPKGYAIVPIDFAGDAVNSAFPAALEVVSWDWRELQRHPDHIDWIPALRAIDNLEKALEGE